MTSITSIQTRRCCLEFGSYKSKSKKYEDKPKLPKLTKYPGKREGGKKKEKEKGKKREQTNLLLICNKLSCPIRQIVCNNRHII